nr:MAG TPA: hypothetical protein [Caudoviricetes sp.]
MARVKVWRRPWSSVCVPALKISMPAGRPLAGAAGAAGAPAGAAAAVFVGGFDDMGGIVAPPGFQGQMKAFTVCSASLTGAACPGAFPSRRHARPPRSGARAARSRRAGGPRQRNCCRCAARPRCGGFWPHS